MTDELSPLDAHSQRLAASLHAGAVRQSSARQRRRRTAILAAPVAIVASAVAALWPASRVDVVERANAALKPATTVVHFRVIAGRNRSAGRTCGERTDNDGAIDVWLETSGSAPRWRVRQPAPPCATVSTGFGHVAKGPSEQAYDGRALVASSPAGGWVERFTDPPAAARRVPDVAQLTGISRDASTNTDPVRFLRNLLDTDRLEVERRGTVRGRDVYWLGGLDQQRGRVRVAIDARTYAPVTIVRAIPKSDFLRKNPKVHALEGTELRFDFEQYEPAEPEDLQPRLPSNPKTIDMDWDDAMTAMDARMRAESRAGHLRALRMRRERSGR